jgi:hypothetical protein
MGTLELDLVNVKVNEDQGEKIGEMTLDDAIDHLGFGWFQVKLLFIAGKRRKRNEKKKLERKKKSC